jgi:hypothetical protein
MNDLNTASVAAHERISARFRGISCSEISIRTASYLLGLFTILAIVIAVIPNAIYIRSYLQDTFGLLDGIHRTVLGQVVHRDFSSGVGIAVFALPALFVTLGADPVNSLTYATSSLLLLNFIIVWHLLYTRISGTQALLFGSLMILTLSSRFVFGEDPQLVTLAMNYNRYCTAFMCSLILFFIPPRRETTRTILFDGLIIGSITTLLFYSKITFGLCALALIILLPVVSWSNRFRALLSFGCFIVVAAVLEMTLRFHAPLIRDILMAIRSSGVTRTSILYEVVANLPEILICAVLPAAALFINNTLTPRIGFLLIGVSMMSIMLLNQSAQLRVMIMPFSLLIVSLHALNSNRSATNSARDRYVLTHQILLAAACFMWITYSYPMVVNLAVSFSKSAVGQPIDSEAGILGKIIVERNRDNMPLVQDLLRDGQATLGVYERAISAAGIPLNESDYVRSILDGVGAVQATCGPQDRVLTADFVNPFPALLNMPVGGGAIYTDSGLLMSEQSHVPAERFFSGIDCLMIPKLPVAYTAWVFISEVYQEYMDQQFVKAQETPYWIVYRRGHS